MNALPVDILSEVLAVRWKSARGGVEPALLAEPMQVCRLWVKTAYALLAKAECLVFNVVFTYTPRRRINEMVEELMSCARAAHTLTLCTMDVEVAVVDAFVRAGRPMKRLAMIDCHVTAYRVPMVLESGGALYIENCVLFPTLSYTLPFEELWRVGELEIVNVDLFESRLFWRQRMLEMPALRRLVATTKVFSLRGFHCLEKLAHVEVNGAEIRHLGDVARLPSLARVALKDCTIVGYDAPACFQALQQRFANDPGALDVRGTVVSLNR